MNKVAVGVAVGGVLGMGLVLGLRSVSAISRGQQSFSGIVQRVWEDGFQLEAGDRTITVDTWNLCGDNTTQFLGSGDAVTVTGEFDGGEFDAFSLTDGEENRICN